MTNAAVEVITSVQRRRRWPRAEKERIVAAAMAPGAVASEVARLRRGGTMRARSRQIPARRRYSGRRRPARAALVVESRAMRRHRAASAESDGAGGFLGSVIGRK